jgi:hypothetical protein
MIGPFLNGVGSDRPTQNRFLSFGLAASGDINGSSDRASCCHTVSSWSLLRGIINQAGATGDDPKPDPGPPGRLEHKRSSPDDDRVTHFRKTLGRFAIVIQRETAHSLG